MHFPSSLKSQDAYFDLIFYFIIFASSFLGRGITTQITTDMSLIGPPSDPISSLPGSGTFPTRKVNFLSILSLQHILISLFCPSVFLLTNL